MASIDWKRRAEELTLTISDFIGGESVPIRGPMAVEKRAGRDGRRLYDLSAGDIGAVDEAVTSARRAFEAGDWSQRAASERADVLYKLAELIENDAASFALAECMDVGKPISASLHGDVPSALYHLRAAASGADKVFAHAHADGAAPNLIYQHRKPVGVVGAIVGWNFPLSLACLKIGPALAMGNSIVLKPSELTSLSAHRLGALSIEAGVPPGVLNIVHGRGEVVGAALAGHNDVDLISFTGSTATGGCLMQAAGASNLKRLVLECGGKSPYLVFEDCPDDLSLIARNIARYAFRNQGQVCTAATRLLVHESLKERLLHKLLKEMRGIRPDDPLDPDARYGSLISEAHLQKVMSAIDKAKSDGAQILSGGRRAEVIDGGAYLLPTLIDDVPQDASIAQDEIFGPVLTVSTFRDDDEAISIANNTKYGLQAYAATRDIGRAQRLGQRLNAGCIMILATGSPSAGGVDIGLEPQKQSGFGGEKGLAGLAAYTVTSTIVVMS